MEGGAGGLELGAEGSVLGLGAGEAAFEVGQASELLFAVDQAGGELVGVHAGRVDGRAGCL